MLRRRTSAPRPRARTPLGPAGAGLLAGSLVLAGLLGSTAAGAPPAAGQEGAQRAAAAEDPGPAPDVVARAAAALREGAEALGDLAHDDHAHDDHAEHDDHGGAGADHDDVDLSANPTLALVDLHEALPTLSGADRAAARTMLARPTEVAGRPTDGAADPFGNGYAGASERLCGPRVCVHYRPPGGQGGLPILDGGGGDADRVDDLDWVRRTRDVLERTWDEQVGRLGYRRPLPDGSRGGDDRLDVYLADVGDQGFYGYCAPEGSPRSLRTAGFCVLDEDFSAAEYGREPEQSLRVTAAHEFFHVVQYAYDTTEDRWLMETTATWMEERVADDVDDNRQYLDASQLVRPQVPLDTFETGGLAQYGNWIFFEHLTERFGQGVVRDVWERAAATRRRDAYSLPAVRGAVQRRGAALPQEYARFAAGNLVPAATYPEGAAYPEAPTERTVRLTADEPASGTVVAFLDHLSHAHVVLTREARDLPADARLRIVVDGPPRSRGSAAHVLVVTGRRVVQVPVPLDDQGRGAVVVPFGAGIGQASVTLANASTRYRCGTGSAVRTCRGTARDDGLRFTARAVVLRR